MRLIRIVAAAAEEYGAPNLRLEGGTALAAYYLHHRESEDLDFFGDQTLNARAFGLVVEEHARQHGIELRSFGASSMGIARYAAIDPEPPHRSVKLDLVQQSPFHLAPREATEEGIHIGSYRDLCAGKLHAVCDRFEERDFYDLHVIVNHGTGASPEMIRANFARVLDDLLESDPGLDPGFVGQAISRGQERAIVSVLKLRLLVEATDAQVHETLRMCLHECVIRSVGSAPRV